MRVLEPIDVNEQFGEDPDIDEVDAYVRTVMQRALNDLAGKRRFPFWDNRQVSNILATGMYRFMTDDTTQAPKENAEKDTSQWVTGDEPMTGAQRSYLHTLAQEAGAEVPEDVTKAEASDLIEELQQKTGRG